MMTLADEIREYVLVAIMKPARRKGEEVVTFTALKVHRGMGIQGNRMPDVCSAIDANTFLEATGARLVERTGPAQSTTAKWTFAV